MKHRRPTLRRSAVSESVTVPALAAAQAAALEIYDTTLRDGAQAEDVSFSVEDKIRVAQHLDELGVQFIEGGWPGANPKDIEFFQMVRRIPFQHATVVAFGSTRKASNPVRKDRNLQALLESGTRTITLFGKSWSFQVTDALNISLVKNLELIEDSIAYLRSKDRRVFYDAEHFFDGYKANPEYALQTIRRAIAGGAERVILCDTNGGTMPWEIREICRAVKQECPVPLGIHAHNDSEMAVANSLVAVESGILQVQGTINGIGERCGNANLCSIIPISSPVRGLRPLRAPLLRTTKLPNPAIFTASPFCRTPLSRLSTSSTISAASFLDTPTCLNISFAISAFLMPFPPPSTRVVP